MPVSDPSSPGGDPLIGRVLSERYRIVRKVGEGGMGTVYQAEHALIEKKVALKVLFPKLTRRADLVARFLQEAKSASRIGHENVIDISDFGQSPEGMVYIAMEFLEGQDLARLIKAEGGALDWSRARPILMQIAKALRAAHEHGIIHRDMKPENVFLVQREGRPDFVKVLDFGIAKAVNSDVSSSRPTQARAVVGTPEYMSPEQAQGLPPDHRIDVYAVGCLMYHMLTGDVPFRADNFMGVLSKHLMEPPVPPRQRRPDLDIPEEVEEICLRALEKDREKRWQDMDALFRALGGAGGEPFESSGGYGPDPSLRLAVLPQPNPSVRSIRPDVVRVAASTPPASETVGEEKPEEAASARAKLTILLAGGAVVLVALMFPKMRASHRPEEAAPAASAPAASTVTATPSPLPRALTPPPAASVPPPPVPPANEAVAPSEKPGATLVRPVDTRARHHRATNERAPAKAGAADEGPPAPAALKTPSGNL